MLLLTHSATRELKHNLKLPTIHEPMFSIELHHPDNILNYENIIITSSYAYEAIKNYILPDTQMWALSIPKDSVHKKWLTPKIKTAKELLTLITNTLPSSNNQTSRILFARGKIVNTDIAHHLNEFGYTVDSYQAYLQKTRTELSPRLKKCIKERKITHISFWSITALKTFESLCMRENINIHNFTPIFKSARIENAAHKKWRRKF